MTPINSGWVPSRAARKDIKRATEAVKKFNRDVPIGSAVAVQLHDGRQVFARVRKPAKLIAGHVAAVWIEALAGFFLVDKVTLAIGDDEAK